MTMQRWQEDFASLEAETSLDEFYELAYKLGCRSTAFAVGDLAVVQMPFGYGVRELADTQVNLSMCLGRDEHGLIDHTQATLADEKASCNYGVSLAVSGECDPLPAEAWRAIEAQELPITPDNGQCLLGV